VELIGRSNHGGRNHSQRRVYGEVESRKRHSPGAQPREAEQSIADKVAAFSNVMVRDRPVPLRQPAGKKLNDGRKVQKV